MTTATLSRATPSQWWIYFRQHAYFYREVAAFTFALGIYVHVSRLVFGDQLVLRYLFPTFDKILAIPMTYAAIAGLAGWKQLQFRSRAHRVLSRVILCFIAISIPLHLPAFFGIALVPISALPKWYSLLEGGVLYPFFLSTVWRLRSAGER